MKISQKDKLLAEKFFIEKYHTILPVETIVKENIENNYIIYNYIKGTELNYKNNIKDLLNDIYHMLNKYITIDVEGYGEIFNLKKTWEEFLREEIKNQGKYIIVDREKLTYKVLKQLEIINFFTIEPKLLHGDFGTFNIIFNNNKVTGIIDSRTIIGDFLYDFIYFIFSNYNITQNVNLYYIVSFLNDTVEDFKKILSLMYILLYIRISIETKNQTNHISDFYNVWNEIENIENLLIN